MPVLGQDRVLGDEEEPAAAAEVDRRVGEDLRWREHRFVVCVLSAAVSDGTGAARLQTSVESWFFQDVAPSDGVIAVRRRA